MVWPTWSRARLADILGDAFGEGLVSERTLAHRLNLLFGPTLVDPQRLVGDITLRRRSGRLARSARQAAASLRRELATVARPSPAGPPVLLLALDAAPRDRSILIGRDASCDVVLPHATVSRRHLRVSRSGGDWVLRDLGSTNGTRVNGQPVVRCQLRRGDRLMLGEQPVDVD